MAGDSLSWYAPSVPGFPIYTPPMRYVLLVITGLILLHAEAFTAPTVAFSPVLVGEQIFVAASDGSGEHALLPNPDVDYDAGWQGVPVRQIASGP